VSSKQPKQSVGKHASQSTPRIPGRQQHQHGVVVHPVQQGLHLDNWTSRPSTNPSTKQSEVGLVAVGVQEQAEDILVPCNSFYCLGHFKNVYDDDEVHFSVTIAWTPTF